MRSKSGRGSCGNYQDPSLSLCSPLLYMKLMFKIKNLFIDIGWTNIVGEEVLKIKSTQNINK